MFSGCPFDSAFRPSAGSPGAPSEGLPGTPVEVKPTYVGARKRSSTSKTTFCRLRERSGSAPEASSASPRLPFPPRSHPEPAFPYPPPAPEALRTHKMHTVQHFFYRNKEKPNTCATSAHETQYVGCFMASSAIRVPLLPSRMAFA